jgi:hypothetical protein
MLNLSQAESALSLVQQREDPPTRINTTTSPSATFDVSSVQPSICAAVSHGSFLVPVGAEAFVAYAIASSKGLIPEMERVAHQTLDHAMAFEILGERL